MADPLKCPYCDDEIIYDSASKYVRAFTHLKEGMKSCFCNIRRKELLEHQSKEETLK